jgi:hypothetical protein
MERFRNTIETTVGAPNWEAAVSIYTEINSTLVEGVKNPYFLTLFTILQTLQNFHSQYVWENNEH